MTDTDTNVTSPAKGEVLPLRPLTEATALEWLRHQPGGRTDLPAAELGRRWGWQRYNVSRRLQRWRRDGLLHSKGASLLQSISSRQRLLQLTCNTLMLHRNWFLNPIGLLQSEMPLKMLQQLRHRRAPTLPD